MNLKGHGGRWSRMMKAMEIWAFSRDLTLREQFAASAHLNNVNDDMRTSAEVGLSRCRTRKKRKLLFDTMNLGIARRNGN